MADLAGRVVEVVIQSQQLFAEKSGYNIEIEEPDAAVQAIVKRVEKLH
jgi:hypothetical protein